MKRLGNVQPFDLFPAPRKAGKPAREHVPRVAAQAVGKFFQLFSVGNAVQRSHSVDDTLGTVLQ